MERFYIMKKDIPKIIWQTHQWEYENLPYDFKMASLTWINMNPGWEYRYVSAKNRSEHIKQYSEELYNYYTQCTPLTQSDIWRLCILYLNGGLYTDADSLCKMNIDFMLKTYVKNNNFICIPKVPSGLIISGTLASRKNSSVAKKILENLYIKSFRNMKEIIPEVSFTFEQFSRELVKNEKYIDFGIRCAFHGSHLGNEYKYNSDYTVQLEFDEIKYFELAKRNNWKFY